MLSSGKRQEKSGQRGIRTLGTVSGTLAFQASPFDHSGICPKYEKSEGKCAVDLAICNPKAFDFVDSAEASLTPGA